MFLLEQAREIADELVSQLRPHCERIDIAGSVRRRAPVVKDIELVCIPKPYETGLFRSGVAEVLEPMQKVRGDLQYRKCRYTQRIHPSGIKLDVFMPVPLSYGMILAIRTGPASYSHYYLAHTWTRMKLKVDQGVMYSRGKPVRFDTEQDFYTFLNLPYDEPWDRKEVDPPPKSYWS